MSALLLPLWVALLGADRIDFLGGSGPIVLTPFYALTPLVILREVLHRRSRGQTALPAWEGRRAQYAALLLTLLSVAALSILMSRDVPTSVGRLLLLVALSCGAGAVCWIGADDPDWGERLARGARWGLALHAALCLVETAAFVHWLPAQWQVGPARLRLDPFTYAGVLPRPSGLTFDPNRAGLVSLVHWALIDRVTVQRRRGWGLLTLALLAATLSRSALLAGLTYQAARGRTDASRERTPRWRMPKLLPVLTGGLAVLLLLAPTWREQAARALAPIAERLDASEGSARAHSSLLSQGLREATRDVPRTIVGAGYGTSFLLLRDRFGGDRYGNYHSLYLTLWVESGIIALLVLLMLLLRPLRFASGWRGLLLAGLSFNLFYQAIGEAAFWMIIALAWTSPVPEPSHPRRHG